MSCLIKWQNHSPSDGAVRWIQFVEHHYKRLKSQLCSWAVKLCGRGWGGNLERNCCKVWQLVQSSVHISWRIASLKSSVIPFYWETNCSLTNCQIQITSLLASVIQVAESFPSHTSKGRRGDHQGVHQSPFIKIQPWVGRAEWQAHCQGVLRALCDSPFAHWIILIKCKD